MIAILFSFMFPLTVFLFYRSILDDKKNRVLIYFITTLLAFLGILSAFILDDYFNLVLFVPLIFYCIYRSFLFVFLKKNNRLPLDTFFDMSWGNWADRLFSIGVFLFGLWLPFIVILSLANNIVYDGLFQLVDSKKTEYRTVSSDAFSVAKCTFVDTSNIEDFAFYEFFVDGKIVKGTTIIEKDTRQDLTNKFFKVSYNSSDISERVLLVNEEVTDWNKIKAAGFR